MTRATALLASRPASANAWDGNASNLPSLPSLLPRFLGSAKSAPSTLHAHTCAPKALPPFPTPPAQSHVRLTPLTGYPRPPPPPPPTHALACHSPSRAGMSLTLTRSHVTHPHVGAHPAEWFFRSSLDRFVWIYGMLCAWAHPHASALLTLIDNLPAVNRALVRSAVLSAVAVVGYFWSVAAAASAPTLCNHGVGSHTVSLHRIQSKQPPHVTLHTALNPPHIPPSSFVD